MSFSCLKRSAYKELRRTSGEILSKPVYTSMRNLGQYFKKVFLFLSLEESESLRDISDWRPQSGKQNIGMAPKSLKYATFLHNVAYQSAQPFEGQRKGAHVATE